MRIIKSEEVDNLELTNDQRLWVYNGFDNCITKEVDKKQRPRLSPKNTLLTYNFCRAMLGPAMTMMCRGIRMDVKERDRLISDLKPRIFKLGGMAKNARGQGYVKDDTAVIQQIAIAINGKPINYNSEKQLKKILYFDLGLPEQKKNDKGVWKVTTDRDALEKLRTAYPRARAFCSVLLRIRDLEKKISVLKSPLKNGRMFTSFNVVGTDTGRWSSKENVFGLGTNLQNITEDLRSCFIPDDGYVMFYADLKTAESVGVGYLAQDEAYIKACMEADLHTIVARLVWPDLPWSGDITTDKTYAASQIYYRIYSYRDMAKRGGHGTNYYGTPKTMGSNLKVEEKIMHRFQTLYYGGDLALSDIYRWGFKDMLKQGTVIDHEVQGKVKKTIGVLRVPGAFPGIRRWHNEVINELQTTGSLTTPLGRKRKFWGRLWDKATWRKAIAFVPQSLIADILNIGLYWVWRRLEPEVQILANGHDAILGQVPVEKADELAKKIVELMEFDVPVHGRNMRIRADINFGKNWAEACA